MSDMTPPTDGARHHSGRSRPDPSVAVVSEHDVFRAGLAMLLDGLGGPAVAVLDHQSAEQELPARSLNAVIIDVDTYGAKLDRFAGISVIERLRWDGGRGPVVCPIAHDPTDESLRLRLVEAGAPVVTSWASISSAELLLDQIRNPEEWGERIVNPVVPRHLGVDDRTRVNALVGVIEAQDLHDLLDPDVFVRDRPLTRREMGQVRSLFGGPEGLRPVTDKGNIREGQVLPSIWQLRRFYAWAYHAGKGTRVEHEMRELRALHTISVPPTGYAWERSDRPLSGDAGIRRS